jgi:hypothetical protein
MAVFPWRLRPPSDDRTARGRLRRAVLVGCVLGGLLVPAYFLGMADVSHFAWDFRAYYTAADAALAGRPFVGIDTGIPGVSYVYPPISVAVFLPHAAVGGWRLAFAFQTALNVCAALALAGLTVRTIESHRGRISTTDRLLVAGFCLGSAPAIAVLGQGQVDLFVALALAGAFVALERGRQTTAGIVLGAVALLKVFPAVLGLWLAWRRAWRALGAALLTGASGIAAGGLLFGFGVYREYLRVLAGRSRVAEFAGTVSPNFFAMTLCRPLSQLFPNTDPHLYALVGVLTVVPLTVLVAFRSRSVVDRLTTYLAAITAMVVISPASNVLYVVYVYFPLLCLLYLHPGRRANLALLAGTLAIAFPVQPAQLRAVATALGIPVAVRTHLLDAVGSVLTVASVPLLGLLAIFAWCLFQSVRERDHPNADVHRSHAD